MSGLKDDKSEEDVALEKFELLSKAVEQLQEEIVKVTSKYKNLDEAVKSMPKEEGAELAASLGLAVGVLAQCQLVVLP